MTNMKRNVSEIEQRLLLLLKKDSRKSLVEISKDLGISRITAKKAFDSLISSGKIRGFTVRLEENERDLALVHVKEASEMAQELALERFSLIDGSSILVVFYEDLLKITGLPIIDVKIATSRSINDTTARIMQLHCDYCGMLINSDPIRVEIKGKSYYVCCPNCERDLRKRRELLADQTNP